MRSRPPDDFNFRCRADRSMPTNDAVRLILPPNRLICVSKVFPLERLPRFPQRQSRQRPGQDHAPLFAFALVSASPGRSLAPRWARCPFAKDQDAFYQVASTAAHSPARPSSATWPRPLRSQGPQRQIPASGIELPDEMRGQFRDVFPPFLQRGHGDRHNIQPMVQFLPERIPHSISADEVPAWLTRSPADRPAPCHCRRRAGTAGPPAPAGSFDCVPFWHIRHFVEIDHPAMGLFQKPRLDPTRSAFSRPNSTSSTRSGAQRLRTVHCHEGGRGPVGIGVDIARRDFLAGSRQGPVSITRPFDLVTLSKLPHQCPEGGRG